MNNCHDVEIADVMFDANGDNIGLRFDDGHIFAMPALLAARLGRSLLDCVAR